MHLTDKQLQQMWNEISVPDDCDSKCESLLETPDGSGTGDSPTLYECDCARARECPIVQAKMEEAYEDQ